MTGWLKETVSAQAKTFLTPEHNLLLANLSASLHQQLRKKDCEVYPRDMRV